MLSEHIEGLQVRSLSNFDRLFYPFYQKDLANGVTEEQLKNYIGKNVDAFTENDVIRLGKVYRSLKDGIVGSDYFLSRMKDAPKVDETTGEVVAEKEATKRSRKKAEPEAVSLDDL
jgi:hypothetical protein